ncbi:toxin-antitoxin system YwqK family antitoxin [Anaerobacillus sp. MEB173]|uniref:toxin-antitoxin system YwqK family antitoxin n=1 Tax=Anaerobacillus sp. MEB173 TaxID=3383345 RepID=UPI003F93D040
MRKGKLYYENGNLKYEGDLINNEPHGSGIGYWENGSVIWYEGPFKGGKPFWKGKFYYKTGQLRYEGEFEGLQYVGQGTEYYEIGTIKFTGRYRKCPYFFYGARLYVEGKLYYKTGQLHYEGTFKGLKNYEFDKGTEYLEDGSVIIHGGGLNY